MTEELEWQEKISKMLHDYNAKFHIFKDPKTGIDKIRYLIEDTHKIRFFEFADNIIEKDVFEENKDLSILKPKKRGRPKKEKLFEEVEKIPKVKKAIGRPKSIDIDIKEGENRKNKVCVKYHVDRYARDPEFRALIKEKRKAQYEKNMKDPEYIAKRKIARKEEYKRKKARKQAAMGENKLIELYKNDDDEK
jgi:hypothetical protein